jgi:hypothetical protein
MNRFTAVLQYFILSLPQFISPAVVKGHGFTNICGSNDTR